ncbi:hypothetical protein QVD17_00891 [Tagetes erecta]|uniref:Uncharacterized protein n=1 Tax=Tagetes erecta TaxID=13708 RepID=A0AAD8L9I7_TARER|nr:hypothetical protein QVD17_00891 [Tagetes erecta]
MWLLSTCINSPGHGDLLSHITVSVTLKALEYLNLVETSITDKPTNRFVNIYAAPHSNFLTLFKVISEIVY